MQKVRETAWKPRPLPFVEIIHQQVEKPIPDNKLESIGKRAHVLVVDDDQDIRQRLVRLFEMAGCDPVAVETNAQALTLLTNTTVPFSLVATDALRRPERAGEEGYVGLDLVRIINREIPELPVILVSRDSPDFLRNLAPDLHIRGVLGKDLSDEETVTMFQRVLAGEILPSSWSNTIASQYIFNVTNHNFDELLLSTSKMIIVYFLSYRSGSCQIFDPEFAAISKEYQGRVTFAKLDVDTNEDLTSQWNVDGIPTVIFFKNGQEINRIKGIVMRDKLRRQIEGILASDQSFVLSSESKAQSDVTIINEIYAYRDVIYQISQILLITPLSEIKTDPVKIKNVNLQIADIISNLENLKSNPLRRRFKKSAVLKELNNARIALNKSLFMLETADASFFEHIAACREYLELALSLMPSRED